MICPICLEEINEKNNCTTLCNHKFCLSCMLESLKYKNSCPICREIIVIIEEEDNSINEEEEQESNFHILTESINTETITNMRYFLRALYVQQITYNIFFGISYGFGVGCGFISSLLIFHKIFKN